MYLNGDKAKLFFTRFQWSLLAENEANNFPVLYFNARKIIFTIIAAFSTIKAELFMLMSSESAEQSAASNQTNYGGNFAAFLAEMLWASMETVAKSAFDW